MSPIKTCTHEGLGGGELRSRAALTNRSGSAEDSKYGDRPMPKVLVFNKHRKIARVNVEISDQLTDAPLRRITRSWCSTPPRRAMRSQISLWV
jgi:hypothetical protein